MAGVRFGFPDDTRSRSCPRHTARRAGVPSRICSWGRPIPCAGTFPSAYTTLERCGDNRLPGYGHSRGSQEYMKTWSPSKTICSTLAAACVWTPRPHTSQLSTWQPLASGVIGRIGKPVCIRSTILLDAHCPIRPGSTAPYASLAPGARPQTPHPAPGASNRPMQVTNANGAKLRLGSL
jgi:hypothetical protein